MRTLTATPRGKVTTMLLQRFCFSKVFLKPNELVFRLNICLLLMMPTSKGHSQETDLSQTMKSMPGDDIVLPCHVERPKDPSQVTVEWGRPDLKPRFVHVWHNQKEFLTDQNKAYKGRTSLLYDKLKDGDISLKLTNVRHSDNGRYRCYNPAAKKEYFVELLVGSASSASISLAGLDGSSSGVMLDCSSAGWYPEPEIIWLDAERNIISVGTPKKTSGPDGLYTVSSRVTVDRRHNNITCRVQQKDINQTRETQIFLPDDFFIHESDCSVCIGFIVILNIMLVFAVIYLIWMKQQNKKKKRTLTNELKEKVNEEQQQLMTEVKEFNVERINLDQQIKALMEISEELEKQKKTFTDQVGETEKRIGETEKKLKAVDDEVNTSAGDKTNIKAQGYLKLKEILTDNTGRLFERKQGEQRLELMTDQLIKRTSDEVNKLKERKKEMDKHLAEIKEHLDKGTNSCDSADEK